MWNLRVKYLEGGGSIICLYLIYWMSTRSDLKGTKELLQTSQLRYPHLYPYLVNPGVDVCGQEEVNLLILVASKIQHQHQRQAIRDTWGRKDDLNRLNYKVVFLLGSVPGVDPQLADSITTESSLHRDIVQEGFIDSYTNLTLKTIGGIKWSQTYCSQAEYVMKTDDDIFLNLRKLNQFLAEQKDKSRRIYGCIKNGAQGAPQPISMSGVKFPMRHPPFTAGAGYVITADILPLLNNVAQNISMIRVEDAFLTGYCADRLGNVDRVHSNLFSCGQLVDKNCDMKSRVSGHKITPERMLKIYSDIKYSC